MAIDYGDPIAITTNGVAYTVASASCDYPTADDVRLGISYNNGNSTGTLQINYVANGATCPLQALINKIDAALKLANKNGDLKDGNINVRNIWPTLDWASPQPAHLPLIQFEVEQAAASAYVGDTMENIPCRVRIISWVNSSSNKKDAMSRARNLREAVIVSLHSHEPFSDQGCAKQALNIIRETDPFIMKRFAVGMGANFTGDILETAGEA